MRQVQLALAESTRLDPDGARRALAFAAAGLTATTDGSGPFELRVPEIDGWTLVATAWATAWATALGDPDRRVAGWVEVPIVEGPLDIVLEPWPPVTGGIRCRVRDGRTGAPIDVRTQGFVELHDAATGWRLVAAELPMGGSMTGKDVAVRGGSEGALTVSSVADGF